MKTIFDPKVVSDIEKRIDALTENSPAHWGKMNVQQMVQHCQVVDKMYLGQTHYSRVWVGYIFGRMALKKVLRNDLEFEKHTPTLKEAKVFTASNFEQEIANWKLLLHEYQYFSDASVTIHPFFGKLTKSEIGRIAYKHFDHHLRQFGV